MLTWALCWMIVKMGGAGKGIGVLLLISMLMDFGIASGFAIALAEILKR